MEIRGEKDALLEAVQSVLRAVSPRATVAVLGGVRIRAEGAKVEFAGTDLEVFVAVQGEFGVVAEGEVVVPGRLFGEVMRSLPQGQVQIRSRGSEVGVQGGSAEFWLTGLPPADFPEFGQVVEGVEATLPGALLSEALKQVVRAAGTDDARPILTGVLWSFEGNALHLAATDSYRLAVRELALEAGPGNASAIVPARALAEFGRQLGSGGAQPATVRLGTTQASFQAGSTKLVTRLIEGEFPDYRRLIPQGYQNSLVVGREALLAAVGRMAIVTQATTPIKLHLGEELKVSGTEPGVGESSEVVPDGKYSGDDMVVGLSPKFLSDGLEVFQPDNVEIEVSDPGKPVVMRGDGRSEFVYLVMPVRLSS